MLRFQVPLTDIFSNSLSEWWETIKKMVRCRFQQWLRPFSMMTVKQCSQTGLFRHFSNHFLRRSSFFSKPSKFNVDFKNNAKNSEKCFGFLDNSIWMDCGKNVYFCLLYTCISIGVRKISLLLSECLSSTVFVLTNSP